MDKILLYSAKKHFYDLISDILASKGSVKSYEIGEEGLDLKEIQVILVGCDYSCVLDSCAMKFIFLYRTGQIPFAILRPLLMKETLVESSGFFLSVFKEQPVSISRELILKLLKGSKFYPGSAKFPVLPSNPLFKIIRAQREIVENPCRLYSLTSLAKILGCSPSWLSSNFHAFSGIKFQTFLIKMRCCSALWQIVSTDKKIKSIAREAGYRPLYFSQLFRRVFKGSPLSLRKSLLFITASSPK